jgi:hypothetical protein
VVGAAAPEAAPEVEAELEPEPEPEPAMARRLEAATCTLGWMGAAAAEAASGLGSWRQAWRALEEAGAGAGEEAEAVTALGRLAWCWGGGEGGGSAGCERGVEGGRPQRGKAKHRARTPGTTTSSSYSSSSITLEFLALQEEERQGWRG